MDELIKMWYTYRMKYYSAIKKNEILLSVTTWMNFERIVLSEIRKRKTNKKSKITLISGILRNKNKTAFPGS